MITALFDGNCVICQTTRVVIKGLDWRNRVEFVDLHERETVNRRFPEMDHERMMGEIHVIDEQGQVFAGFNGTKRLLRAVPLGLPLWLLLSLPGMGWLGPVTYRFIARHRYAINRLFGVDLRETEADYVDGVCKIPER